MKWRLRLGNGQYNNQQTLRLANHWHFSVAACNGYEGATGAGY